MSTKKKLLLTTLVLSLVGGLWGYKKVKSMIRGGDLEDIAVFVPKDVSVFLANRGAGEQMFEFDRMGDIMNEAGPRTTHYLDVVREAATPVLGFDPLVSDNWQATGMSFYRPAGFAVAGDSLENVHLLFYLPVGDEETLLKTLDDGFVRAGASIDVEQVSEHELHVVKGLGGFFPLVLNYAEHDGYVIGVFGMEGSFEPIAALDGIWNMADGESILDDPAFQNRVASVGSAWHSLTYTSSTAMEAAMMGLNEVAGMYGVDLSVAPLAGSSAVGTTHLTDDHFRYRGTQRILPGLVDPIWFNGVNGKDKLGHRIPGSPLVASRISLNLEAIWKSSMAQDMGAEAFVADLLSEGLDVDIEKDIVQNIEGHFSTVVFEPNMTEEIPELLFYAPIKNSTPIESLVDSGCRILTLWGAKLEKDDSGVWCTDGATTFFGVAHDHLLLGMSQTPEIYRTLEGDGYLNALPSEAQKGLDGGPAGFGYINLEKSIDLVQAQNELLEAAGWPEVSFPPSMPVQGITAGFQLVEGKPETELDEGLSPFDMRLEVQGLMTDGGLQDWLSAHLEDTVVWAEALAAETNTAGGSATETSGVEATLREISDWQQMGADELGEPYAACGTEEKATALVNGGDPNTVYSDEDRACFENIGWTPAAGNTAFWTEIQGPEGSPTGFTVIGLEKTGTGIQQSRLQHPAEGQ